MKKLPHRVLMVVGLLCVSAAVGFRALFPQWSHGDAGDFGTGLLAGVGLGIELAALWKMRKDRQRAS